MVQETEGVNVLSSRKDTNEDARQDAMMESDGVMRCGPTLKELRSAQPAGLSEGYIGLVYRQISLPVTWLLVRTPVTANQISMSWLVLGMVAMGLLGTGIYGWVLLGALLLEVVAVLDRVDGEVARWKQSQSVLGVFYDWTGHICIKSLLFIAVSLGVYRSRPDVGTILLGISGACSLIIGQSVSMYKTYIFLRNGVHGLGRPLTDNRVVRVLRKAENLWWTLGLFGVVTVGALSNGLYYVLVFYGVSTPIWALSVTVRVGREIGREDAERRGKRRGVGSLENERKE